VLTRLHLAAFLGSVVGFERERLLWGAGIRTHMAGLCRACLIMIVSAFGFGDSLTSKNVVLDPSRVAAQVASGIGFLGAGAILARGEIVRGLAAQGGLYFTAAVFDGAHAVVSGCAPAAIGGSATRSRHSLLA
jgi:putative Mg2+ transporter-C (MgtC) family protein